MLLMTKAFEAGRANVYDIDREDWCFDNLQAWLNDTIDGTPGTVGDYLEFLASKGT